MLTNRLYLAMNLGIALGIAADAMLATLARARTFNKFRDALKWASAIGLTHWLFPMIGFLGGWYLTEHGARKAVVYGVGGAILAFYIFQVLRERSTTADGDLDASSRISFWLAVWGVSIDALITGPGKAAATAHWTRTQVALSFPLVGAAVFLLVLLSTFPAMLLHRTITTSPTKSERALATFFFAATWVEIVIFTWFATLSLVEAAGAMRLLVSSYSLVSFSAGIVVLFLVICLWNKVWLGQLAASRHVLQLPPAVPKSLS